MPNTVEETLDRLNGVLKDYIQASRDPSVPLNEYCSPQAMREKVDLDLPEQGLGEEQLSALAKTYLDQTVRTGSWRYLNQLWSGFSLPGLVGEMTAAASNTSMFTYEVAPLATLIEKTLIQRLCELVGFERGGGLFVTGGSNANLLALMAARFRLDPMSMKQGIDGRPLRIFVSEQAHYSFHKAANLMGLGVANVIAVASDAAGRMSPEALQRAIADERAQGATPFCVAATAGTTVIGAYDPIEAIADICEAEDIWFHIDAAWGGSVLISDKLRTLMAGCERADSLTWDQHKMMGLPLICSTILMKDATMLGRMNNVGGEDYIFHDGDAGDLGPMSLQCGRRVDALKLWLAWKSYGRAGFAERIEKLFDLSQYFAERLKEHPRFELAAPVASLNLCFRYRPDTGLTDEEVDQGNVVARKHLARSGQALINYAQVKNRPCWRLILTNFDLTEELVDAIFDEVEAACVQAFHPTFQLPEAEVSATLTL
jgi:glutamate/tyrosine decarboxylase-like PLP-dependent enzyme